MLWPKSSVVGEARDERSQVIDLLFSRSPLGALALDGAGVVARANEALACIVGSTTAALEGRLVFEIQPDGDAALMRAAIEEARRGATPAAFGARFVRADGSLAPCRINLAPIQDAEGQFAYALGSVEDLSQSAAAEATLLESEERFRTLVEVSPDAVLFFVRGVVEHANPAALRLLGAQKLEELVGRKSTDLVHPSSVPLVEERVAALMAGGSVPAVHEIYIRLDGTTVNVETTAARVPLASGKAFVIIVRDINDRMQNEGHAREQHEARAASAGARERELWLRKIIDLLPSFVYARDEAGVLVLANRAFAEVLGLTPRDVVGRTLDEVGVPADGAPASLEHDRVVLTTGRPTFVQDEVFIDRAGRRRIFETSRVKFSDRARAAVLCVSTDVTERKRFEAELMQAQKLEAIGRLAGGIAHDFNNLLTVLVASAEELAAQRSAPDADLTRILSVASRATALTRQLLAFARSSAVEVRELLLNDVVEDMVNLLARVLGEEISIVTALDPRAGSVLVDRRSMDRVLMNLAVNARDAMPGGGTLTFRTRQIDAPDGAAGQWVALSVADTGTGMSEETRAHVFEPFFTTKATGEGTGLGLATCFGIVQQAAGRIDVASAPGRGTTFRILLPEAAPSAQPYATVPPPSSAPLGNELVLLLDDDVLVRSATTRVLKRLGYCVLVAATPEEAITIARTHEARIDLLLTDVVMPGMSGPQTAKAIREVLPDLPVLYISGYSKDAQSLADVGANLLPKPFSRYELGTKLREALAAAPARDGRPLP